MRFSLTCQVRSNKLILQAVKAGLTGQIFIYNSTTILTGWPVYSYRTVCKAGKRQQ